MLSLPFSPAGFPAIKRRYVYYGTQERYGYNYPVVIMQPPLTSAAAIGVSYLEDAEFYLQWDAGSKHFVSIPSGSGTVYPKKYAHGFVVLCFVVDMQSFIMNSHEVFIHIHQGCFAGTGAIVRLPQCQWSKPGGYGKISQCITTTKHSKAKTVCIFLGIYCIFVFYCIWKRFVRL